MGVEWHFNWVEIIAGAFGGLVSFLLNEKAEDIRHLRWFSLFVAVIAGAFVAFLVNTHPALSGLMGYSANDVLRLMRKRLLEALQNNGSNEKK